VTEYEVEINLFSNTSNSRSLPENWWAEKWSKSIQER